MAVVVPNIPCEINSLIMPDASFLTTSTTIIEPTLASVKNGEIEQLDIVTSAGLNDELD
jgi:hypothetical protein